MLSSCCLPLPLFALLRISFRSELARPRQPHERLASFLSYFSALFAICSKFGGRKKPSIHSTQSSACRKNLSCSQKSTFFKFSSWRNGVSKKKGIHKRRSSSQATLSDLSYLWGLHFALLLLASTNPTSRIHPMIPTSRLPKAACSACKGIFFTGVCGALFAAFESFDFTAREGIPTN